MIKYYPTVLLSGLGDPSHIKELRALAESVGGSLLTVVPPGTRHVLGADGIDLTAYIDWESCIEACRRSAVHGGRVFVREPQIRYERLANVIRSLELRVVALDTDVSYDDDPSWIVERIELAQQRVAIEYYIVDLFTGVEASWDFFIHETRPEEFGPEDLRDLCARFPILLTADVSDANVLDIASFPGARGLLLTCDELRPTYPADRHAVSFEAIRGLLRRLWNGRTVEPG